MKKIIALSFFSGAWWLDIWSHLAWVPVLAALDFDKDSTLTMKSNDIFSNTKIYYEDIADFNTEEYKKILKENIFDKFILIWWPPCQPFSKAWYWIWNDSRKKEKDPRNMIWNYLQKILELQPDWFLLENVESLLHPSNKQVIQQITLFLDSIWYNYFIYKANALNFWVPQKRKRIFIFWSKKKFKGEPIVTHWNEEEVKNNNKLKLYKKTIEVIEEFDNIKYFEKEELTIWWTYHEDLQKVPPWKNYIALTKPPLWPHKKFKAGKRFRNFLLKLSPDEPSWTIAAQPWPWVWPFHWSWRRLRVPEIAAIQTFPKWYKFVWSRRSIQKQIWNAVPPMLWKAMIEYLIKNI